MARFKIVDSVKGPPPYFSISDLEGDLNEGQEFILYDTHHPCRYTIKSIVRDEQPLVMYVAQYIPWNHAWQNAIVDTDNPEGGKRYGHHWGYED